jgi:hypothetical protein
LFKNIIVDKKKRRGEDGREEARASQSSGEEHVAARARRGLLNKAVDVGAKRVVNRARHCLERCALHRRPLAPQCPRERSSVALHEAQARQAQLRLHTSTTSRGYTYLSSSHSMISNDVRQPMGNQRQTQLRQMLLRQHSTSF